jgi:hypothetical protein
VKVPPIEIDKRLKLIDEEMESSMKLYNKVQDGNSVLTFSYKKYLCLKTGSIFVPLSSAPSFEESKLIDKPY